MSQEIITKSLLRHQDLKSLIDGENCINVFSSAETDLGRQLSNFSHLPFEFEGQTFQSVEGWWYWYSCGEEPILKFLYGAEAKKVGQSLQKEREITPDILKQVFYAKLNAHPELKQQVKNSTLPFVHYYVMYGKKIFTDSHWTGELWSEIRKEL